MINNKLFFIFLLPLTVIILFIFSNQITNAANCGGAVVCACGDTVTASTTLTANLTCTGHGLTVGAHNITIDGDGHTITGDGGSTDKGIINSGGYDGITVRNFSGISNFGEGIDFANSTGGSIENNLINSNSLGMFLQSGGSFVIENNTIDSSGIGLTFMDFNSNTTTNNVLRHNEKGVYSILSSSNTYINNIFESNNNGISLEIMSDSNLLNGNIFKYGVREIYDISSNNSYINNQFLYNIGTTNTIVSFTEKRRLVSVGEIVTSTISFFNINGTSCSDCSYYIALNPSSDSLTTNKINNQIFNSFTPTKKGLYSLSILATDAYNNVSKKDFVFFVGDTNSYTTRYYFRGVNPIHGQPTGSGSDSKSLSFTTPSVTETWNCADWIQNSPDVLPSLYPISSLSGINTFSWYKTTAAGYIGAQRFVSYDNIVGASSSIPIATTTYTWINRNLTSLDWSMDSPQSWYWLALKLKGSNPYQQTTAAQPSYADFTYQYTITPGIKSISNDNVAVLSATAPVNSTSTPSIVLENRLSVSTSTTITLSNLATSTYYQVTVDGSISSVVSGSACNDNRLCLTDSNGILSLTYLANDSSMHTLGLINYPGSFSLISPEDNYRVYSESSMPTLTWQASSDNGSGIAKYQLYIDDTLHTDNINSASTSIEISKPSEGLHHWYIKSVDNNGNVTQSPSFSIIITTASGNDTFSSYTPTPSSISVPTQPISTTTQETITLTNTIRTLQIQLISLLQQLLNLLLQRNR